VVVYFQDTSPSLLLEKWMQLAQVLRNQRSNRWIRFDFVRLIEAQGQLKGCYTSEIRDDPGYY
jgi:hypothetical protein